MTILLVEDNVDVRRLIHNMLAAEGHVVLDAGSAEVAVSLVESATERIDLLITDVVLPHMSGYDLAQWTRALHPETAVIYISGYLESELLERSRNDPAAVFLQKPFTPAQLAEAMREVLTRRRSSSGA